MDNIDKCPICSNPDAATWRERFDHGCSKPNEVWRCVWCGEPHLIEPGTEMLHGSSGAGWCAGCQEKHKAANPDCEWFRGWIDVADTMPGGPLDGIWENSGLKLEFRRGE